MCRVCRSLQKHPLQLSTVKRKRKDFEALKEEGEKQYLGFVNFFFEKKEEKKETENT